MFPLLDQIILPIQKHVHRVRDRHGHHDRRDHHGHRDRHDRRDHHGHLSLIHISEPTRPY